MFELSNSFVPSVGLHREAHQEESLANYTSKKGGLSRNAQRKEEGQDHSLRHLPWVDAARSCRTDHHFLGSDEWSGGRFASLPDGLRGRARRAYQLRHAYGA